MATRIISLILIVLLAGCLTKEEVVYHPVEVQVPVPVRVEPPAELLEPVPAELPEFIAPVDQRAVVALPEQDAKLLLRLLSALKARLDAWQAWATAE